MASDEQFVLFCHDDVEFLFDGGILERVLEDYSKDSKLGFIGAAGAWELGKDAIWWNARRIGKSSGFVFQGKDIKTMVPNYFGMYRNVVALDGCFFGAKLGVIKTIGLDKPGYLTSDWDFYDIHMTVSAHLKGYNNYAVPLIIKHESSGEMRDQWYKSRDEFISRHKQYLPLSVGRIG